jgi:hypothetical protein
MGYERPTSVYTSKRDTWIVVLLWIGVGGMGIAAASVWATSESIGFRLGITLLLLATAGFALWVLYGTYYTLTDSELLIRSGPFRWRVEVDAIVEIFPTRNPLSSPACSIDRLRIRHRGSGFGVMISPINKAAFLRDVAGRSSVFDLETDNVGRPLRVSRAAGRS